MRSRAICEYSRIKVDGTSEESLHTHMYTYDVINHFVVAAFVLSTNVQLLKMNALCVKGEIKLQQPSQVGEVDSSLYSTLYVDKHCVCVCVVCDVFVPRHSKIAAII